MCGITGIVDLKGRREVERALLRKMNDLLSHRGPDGDGLHLEAANPAYPCLDLHHCTDVQIWGVAVHVIHPL